MTPQEFKKARKDAGLLQRELAVLLGLTERHIRKLEKGETPISKVIEIAVKEVLK